MKAINKTLLFIFFFQISSFAQQNNKAYEDFIKCKAQSFEEIYLRSGEKYYANDSSYRAYFYHLKLYPSIDSNFLEGEVKYKVQSLKNNLNLIKLDLAEEFEIVSFSGLKSVVHDGRVLHLELLWPVDSLASFQFELEYRGKPALLNNIKGLVYKLENSEQPLIASLSTPYLAHQWWPCQDGPENKADSVYVDINIPEKYIGGRLVTAVSNGILENTIVSNSGVTFEWRHRYPIVPYYIMMAISNYELIEDLYESPLYESFPLEYFVFGDHLNDALEGVAPMPLVMEFFEEKFGPYPFSNEKYGMTQLGFYGGIENQTNSIMNRLSEDYFMVSVHELAHMWFGDKLTCNDWHEAWLNEGFASYAECLWIEHVNGQASYQAYLNNKKYLGPGSMYLNYDNDPFKIFVTIIYHKGAWFLHMLRRLIGDESFFKTIIEYANHPQLAYGHVKSTHLKHIAEVISDQDLDYFFDQWIYGERHPVYLYNFDQNEQGKTKVFIQQNQEEKYGSQTVFKMPLDIKFNFTDGSETVKKVENSLSYQTYDFQFTKVVESIELDPSESILCEKQYDIKLSLDKLIYNKFVQIQPNPVYAGNEVRITCDEEIKTIQLFDGAGKQIIQHDIASGFTNTVSLSIPTDVISGHYSLIITTEKNQLTKALQIFQ